jgi:hypothetical protein
MHVSHGHGGETLARSPAMVEVLRRAAPLYFFLFFAIGRVLQ